MTYLELVNKVLKKLRETEVAAVTESAYSKLIGEFINEAKEEVEDSWDWTALRQDISVTTAAATSKYSVTGLGQRFDILGSLNITKKGHIFRAPYAWVREQLLLTPVATGNVGYYNIYGVDSNNDPYVEVYPLPDDAQTLTFNAVIRQAELVADGTTLLIPSSPVVLGAYYRAVKERGEDSGDASAQAAADYSKVWNAAVARDVALQEEETEWQVV